MHVSANSSSDSITLLLKGNYSGIQVSNLTQIDKRTACQAN